MEPVHLDRSSEGDAGTGCELPSLSKRGCRVELLVDD